MITGVTRGLGRAMVSEFAKLGWTVAGCGRNEILLSELRKQYPAPHQFLAADLTSEESISAFTNTALSGMGAPDLLLNNGGIINHNAPLWEIGEAEFAEVMDINVKGVASIIRHTSHKGSLPTFHPPPRCSTHHRRVPCDRWAVQAS